MNSEAQRKSRMEHIKDILSSDKKEILTEWEIDFLTDVYSKIRKYVDISPGTIEKYREVRKKAKGF